MSSSIIDNRRNLAIAVWTAVLSSVTALVLSGLAFVSTLDDDDYERTVEARLVCLELPGPNDCGLDGK